jgi:hypothetical protein
VAIKEKNPREPPAKCPPHDFGDLELTPEGEAKRRQALEDKRTNMERHWRKNEYDADRLGPVHGDVAGGNKAALNARIQAGQVDDIEFEQRVGKEAGVFTNIYYECKLGCGLKGDLDVVTKGGVIKECKNNGGAGRDQLEKHAVVGAAIIPGFAGVHTAVPMHNYRSMKDSLQDQGMADVEIQIH